MVSRRRCARSLGQAQLLLTELALNLMSQLARLGMLRIFPSRSQHYRSSTLGVPYSYTIN